MVLPEVKDAIANIERNVTVGSCHSIPSLLPNPYRVSIREHDAHVYDSGWVSIERGRVAALEDKIAVVALFALLLAPFGVTLFLIGDSFEWPSLIAIGGLLSGISGTALFIATLLFQSLKEHYHEP